MSEELRKALASVTPEEIEEAYERAQERIEDLARNHPLPLEVRRELREMEREAWWEIHDLSVTSQDDQR